MHEGKPRMLIRDHGWRFGNHVFPYRGKQSVVELYRQRKEAEAATAEVYSSLFAAEQRLANSSNFFTRAINSALLRGAQRRVDELSR